MKSIALVLLVPLLSPTFQESSTEALLKQLGDDSIEVREKAAAALIAQGEKVEVILKARLESADAAMRSRIESVLQVIRRTRNFQAILPPVKKITLEAKEKPWIEVAKEFQRQTGWPLDLTKAPEQPVTLRVVDAAPFEALDALCRVAELGFKIESLPDLRPLPGAPKVARGLEPGVDDYSDPAGIRFSRDYYNLGPRIYIRQYSVSLGGVALTKGHDFKAHTSMGLLALRLMWPPAANPESIKEFRVDSIQDDRNRELFNSAVEASVAGVTDINHLWPEGEARMVYFNYPAPDAKKIARIKGRASFTYPVDDVLVTFSRPKDAVGRRETFDGVEIHLAEYRTERDFVFATVEVSGKRTRPFSGRRRAFASDGPKVGIDKDFVRLRTAGGETTEQVDHDLMQKPDCWVVRLRYVGVKSEVLALEFIMETVYQTDSFEFEFKDIELPK